MESEIYKTNQTAPTQGIVSLWEHYQKVHPRGTVKQLKSLCLKDKNEKTN